MMEHYRVNSRETKKLASDRVSGRIQVGRWKRMVWGVFFSKVATSTQNQTFRKYQLPARGEPYLLASTRTARFGTLYYMESWDLDPNTEV